MSNDFPYFGHDMRNAAIKKFFDADNPNTLLQAPIDIIQVISCATNTDLNKPLRIYQPFFNSTSKRCSMGKFLPAEIAVKQISMTVKLDQSQWFVITKCPQYWQGDQMISTSSHRNNILRF